MNSTSKKIFTTFFAAFLAVAVTPSAPAQDFWDLPPPTIGDWNVDTNWLDNTQPLATDPVRINNAGTAEVSTLGEVGMNLVLGQTFFDTGNLRVVTGGNLAIGGQIRVGDDGVGSILINGTGVLTSGSGVIGRQDDGLGDVTLRDDGTWSLTGNLTVAESGGSPDGGGSLRVVDTANVIVGNNMVIGDNVGSMGDVVTRDSAATPQISIGNNLAVGRAGTGQLNILDDSTVDVTNDVRIGADSTGVGEVNVRFGLFAVGGFIAVGVNGEGTLNIRDGGLVFANNSAIAVFAGSDGEVRVQGPGSTFNISGTLLVGGGPPGVPGGDGRLRIEDNGTVNATSTTVFAPGFLIVDSTYTLNSALTFDGGTLRFVDDTDFINDATLAALGVVVDSLDTTSTISGMFSGPGELSKVGTGTVFLTNTNTYTGNTNIFEGALIVNGSTTSPFTRVAPGALLGGTGTIVGDVGSRGIVSPGPGPLGEGTGTLTVGVTPSGFASYFNDGGTFRAEIGGLNAGVNADLLSVVGETNINGGTKEIIRVGGFDPSPGDRVTIIDSSQILSGTFDTLVPIGWVGLIQPFDAYTEFTADIVFELSATFESQGITRNQICVGENLDDAALSSDPDAIELVTLIGNLPVADLPAAFDLLAPEELASIYEIGFSHALLQGVNFQRRLSDIRAGATGYCALEAAAPSVTESSGGKGTDGKVVLTDKNVGPVVEVCPDKRWGTFGTGYGQTISVGQEDPNARGYEIDSGGFTTGADYRIGSHFAVGIGGGFARSRAELVNEGHVDVGTGYAGVYASVFGGGFYLDAAANAGWADYDIERFALGGVETGVTNGAEFNGVIGFGYDWKRDCLTIGPWATFQYTYVEFDSFDEEGGSVAPLHFPDQHQEAGRGALGLKVAFDSRKGNMIWRPELRAAWQHEFGDTDYAIDWSFRDITDQHICSVFGPRTGQDSALVDAGFSLIFGRCQTVAASLFYNGNIGRNNDTRHAATGGLRVSF